MTYVRKVLLLTVSVAARSVTRCRRIAGGDPADSKHNLYFAPVVEVWRVVVPGFKNKSGFGLTPCKCVTISS